MASLDPSMQSSIRNRPSMGGGTASRCRSPRRRRWSASAAGGRVAAILVGHYVAIIIISSSRPSSWTGLGGASAQLLPPGYESPTEDTNCWEPCKFEPDTNTAVPLTECKQFYVCRNGRVTNKLACSDGRAFDVSIGACNHADLVDCQDPTCPPTDFPTVSPTENPTVSPSVSPTVSPTKSPTTSPTTSPTESPSDSPTVSPTISPQFATMHIRSKRGLVEEHVLKSYDDADGDGRTSSHPSVRYTFDGLMAGLAAMGDEDFGDGIEFFLFDRHWEDFVYGLINVAAFLSQAMAEGIYDDTCDELNWQQVAGRYAISNSCGQEGRSYQDETCGIYSCIVDVNMEATAIDTANKVRAPPPMECRPGTGANHYSGYWDTNTGIEVKNTPYANTAGRIDVEGCCYWGRGVLLTRGSCNIGKLDYYLGARADREGRKSIYPDVDFCADPEAPCASEYTEELRWTAALFEWSERVQRYPEWSYRDELFKFFDGGMVDDSFIDTVSRIYAHDCHDVGCSRLDVRRADKRKANFYVVINDVFGIGGIQPVEQTPPPTRRPTRRPTPAPVTPQPTPRPSDPYVPQPVVTPMPTPRPSNPYAPPRPTPRPLDTSGQVDLTQQPPTFPPFAKSAQNPTTTPRPTFVAGAATPRPVENLPPLWQSPDGDDTTYDTSVPTYSPSTALIPIEDNGGKVGSVLSGCASYCVIFGVATLHLLLANT